MCFVRLFKVIISQLIFLLMFSGCSNEVGDASSDSDELSNSGETVMTPLGEVTQAPALTRDQVVKMLDDGTKRVILDLQTGAAINATSSLVLHTGWWGDWATSWAVCPRTDQRVMGMVLKSEASCGSCDDTALNGVIMLCSTSTGTYKNTIKSTEQIWGSWGNYDYCYRRSDGVYWFADGGEIQIEGKQGSGDDTAANNVHLTCSYNGSGQDIVNPGPTTNWGTWYGTPKCPSGYSVCGTMNRIEAQQGSGDDSALNGVALLCCSPFYP
jgi:hypothetical protein